MAFAGSTHALLRWEDFGWRNGAIVYRVNSLRARALHVVASCTRECLLCYHRGNRERRCRRIVVIAMLVRVTRRIFRFP